MKHSPVYWITGLSNCGKSTLGRLLAARLREKTDAVVLLDGDELRNVYGEENTYAPEDRKRIALRNARLCKLLASQGVTVVCSTISLFHEVQQWNRENIPGYREIYLEAEMEILRSRDTRGVYAGRSVAGVQVPVELPVSPDLRLRSDELEPEGLVRAVLDRFEGISA